MNKTIINGIDVSEWELKGVLIPITECKYFEGIGDCKESKGLCVDNNDCYFKQLKRLQEENEKLKKRCEELDKITGIFSVRLANKYKQALEDIRDIINSVKNEYINTKNKELALYHTELNGALSVAESIEDKINEVLNE